MRPYRIDTGPRALGRCFPHGLRAGRAQGAADACDQLTCALERRIAQGPPEQKGTLAEVPDAIVGVGRHVGGEVSGAAVGGRIPV